MFVLSVSLLVPVKLLFAYTTLFRSTRNVLVVTPLGKVAPLARPALWVTTAPGQLSELLTLKVTLLLLHWPMRKIPRMKSGQLLIAFAVSLMVTVKLHVAVLPVASVT